MASLPTSAKELFLGNSDCKLPCWGGIIIGKTPLNDAYSLINPVVKLDSLRNSACQLGQCKWYPWVHMLGDKTYSGALLSKEDEMIYAIIVEGDYSEDVSFSRLLSLYGNPSKTFVYAHAGIPPDNGNPPVKSYQSEVDNSWQNRNRSSCHEEVEVYRRPDRKYFEGS